MTIAARARTQARIARQREIQDIIDCIESGVTPVDMTNGLELGEDDGRTGGSWLAGTTMANGSLQRWLETA